MRGEGDPSRSNAWGQDKSHRGSVVGLSQGSLGDGGGDQLDGMSCCWEGGVEPLLT